MNPMSYEDGLDGLHAFVSLAVSYSKPIQEYALTVQAYHDTKSEDAYTLIDLFRTKIDEVRLPESIDSLESLNAFFYRVPDVQTLLA